MPNSDQEKAANKWLYDKTLEWKRTNKLNRFNTLKVNPNFKTKPIKPERLVEVFESVDYDQAVEICNYLYGEAWKN